MDREMKPVNEMEDINVISRIEKIWIGISSIFMGNLHITIYPFFGNKEMDRLTYFNVISIILYIISINTVAVVSIIYDFHKRYDVVVPIGYMALCIFGFSMLYLLLCICSALATAVTLGKESLGLRLLLIYVATASYLIIIISAEPLLRLYNPYLKLGFNILVSFYIYTSLTNTKENTPALLDIVKSWIVTTSLWAIEIIYSDLLFEYMFLVAVSVAAIAKNKPF